MCTAAGSFQHLPEDKPNIPLNLSKLSHEIRAGIQKSFDDFVEQEKQIIRDVVPDKPIKKVNINENLVNNVNRTEFIDSNRVKNGP